MRTLVLLLVLLLVPHLALAHNQHDTQPGKTAILLVAFGSSLPEARLAIDGIVERARAAHPDTMVRLAYTSAQVRRKLAAQGAAPDSPLMALARLAEDGADAVAVQPLHLLPGEEFHELAAQAMALRGVPGGFRRMAVGAPLMSGNADLEALANALAKEAGPLAAGETLVLVGHGTHHGADVLYPALNDHLRRQGVNALVGTIEGFPALQDVLAELAARKARAVRLRPLLGVAGDHVVNDILGEEPGSWKTAMETAGLKVTPLRKGLLELQPAADIWLAHLDAALEGLAHSR